MIIIVNTPNYKFGQDMKKSAPAGIGVVVARHGAHPPDSDFPAAANVMFYEAKPCAELRQRFVAWLLEETTKDERCRVSYGGVTIPKHAPLFGQIFDDMVKHINGTPNPEDET